MDLVSLNNHWNICIYLFPSSRGHTHWFLFINLYFLNTNIFEWEIGSVVNSALALYIPPSVCTRLYISSNSEREKRFLLTKSGSSGCLEQRPQDAIKHSLAKWLCATCEPNNPLLSLSKSQLRGGGI